MMFSRLLCRRTGVESSISLSQILLPRYFSQTVVSFKPTLTCALHLTRDARSLPVSMLRVSNLSFSVYKQNEEILTKGNPSTFASVLQKGNSPLDINTNVSNNVFLYKFERPKFFKYMNGFGVLHLLFWIGISYVTWMQLPVCDLKQDPLKKYLNDNFITILIAMLAVLVGIGSALLIWAFTAKSVKYLILNKGGKTVTFVTYHPLNKNVTTTAPIDTLKCSTGRKEMKNYLPVKLKGRSFYYILDSGGEFVNPTLFDHTVGMRS